MPPLLQVKGVSKRFGPVQALDNVSFSLDAGEILGIVGENGAGKSTLIKILGGAYHPDAGEILLDGRQVTIESPEDGLNLGFAVIYQELSLVPELSVAENLFLGHLPTGILGSVDRKVLLERSAALLERIQLDVNPTQRVSLLRIDARQLIEVGKALSRDVRILIMDEPTSSLNEKEIAHLFAVVRSLRETGVAIIYISHYLEEVFALCDRVMVLRDGQEVGIRDVQDWTPAEIVRAMVDRSIEDFYPKATVQPGAEVLTLRNLSLTGRVENASFTVREGEIVGLAGLPGSGINEVMQMVAGILEPTSGEMTLLGQPYTPTSPRAAIARQVGYLPEDRKEKGLFLEFSIEKNVVVSILDRLSTWGVLHLRTMAGVARDAMKTYRIKAPGVKTPVKDLSGGNQQKVLLARVGQVAPRLQVMNDPTRGIDVGAKVEVYERIGEYVQQGGAVLLLSSELPELIGICDRIIVFRDGRQMADIPRNEFSQDLIMTYAAGTADANNGGMP